MGLVCQRPGVSQCNSCGSNNGSACFFRSLTFRKFPLKLKMDPSSKEVRRCRNTMTLRESQWLISGISRQGPGQAMTEQFCAFGSESRSKHVSVLCYLHELTTVCICRSGASLKRARERRRVQLVCLPETMLKLSCPSDLLLKIQISNQKPVKTQNYNQAL